MQRAECTDGVSRRITGTRVVGGSFSSLNDKDVMSVREVGFDDTSSSSQQPLDEVLVPLNTPVTMKYPMYIMKCTTFMALKESDFKPHQALLAQKKVEHWQPHHRTKRIAFISHQVGVVEVEGVTGA